MQKRLGVAPLDIILVGPYGAGKSTIASLISQKLGWSWCSLDNEYYRYLQQMEGVNINLVNEMNTWELISPKWEPYDTYVIERFLLEHSSADGSSVLEFGAGHSVYESREFFDHIQQILSPYPNIVLLLPSPNLQESLQILLDRIRNHGLKGRNLSDEQINRTNKYIIEHHSNYDLAKIVVYTRGKLPDETSEEICQLVTL
jgi:shikimate kinase